MPIEPNAEAPSFPDLPPELTIENAADTHARWMGWWQAHSPAGVGSVEVDGRSVRCVDGAGLQLLLSLRQLLARHDLGLRLANPSEALRSACAALGAPGLTGDAGTAPGSLS